MGTLTQGLFLTANYVVKGREKRLERSFIDE